MRSAECGVGRRRGRGGERGSGRGGVRSIGFGGGVVAGVFALGLEAFDPVGRNRFAPGGAGGDDFGSDFMFVEWVPKHLGHFFDRAGAVFGDVAGRREEGVVSGGGVGRPSPNGRRLGGSLALPDGSPSGDGEAFDGVGGEAVD